VNLSVSGAVARAFSFLSSYRLSADLLYFLIAQQALQASMCFSVKPFILIV